MVKTRIRVFVAATVLTALLAFPSFAFAQSAPPPTIEVYPAPEGVMSSSQYTVQIIPTPTASTKNAAPNNSFVYQTQNPAFLPDGQPSGLVTSSTLEQTTAWTTFSMNAPVTVQVTNTKPFLSARILPTSAGIVPTLNGSTLSFPMSTTGRQQVSVDFCYTSTICNDTTDTDISHPLLVFANPLQGGASKGALMAIPGTTVPPLNGQSMVFFGPGVYDLGTTPYTLGSNQTAFLAGGAYVKGMFALANGATNVTIDGRGILSGENVQKSSCSGASSGCPPMIGGQTIVGNTVIQGITITDAPFFNIALGGVHNTVRDIKVMSWIPSTDGIGLGRNTNGAISSIGDSFFKTGDDAVKLFSSNLLVSGCTFWQLNNAAPIELGVNQNATITNVTVQDTDVIRTETVWPNRSNAVFSAAQGGNAQLSNYVFNNINVENSNFQLFKIAVIPNTYTVPGNNSLGSISNLSFSNIHVTDAQRLPNLFQSYDLLHTVNSVTFNDVFVAGQKLPAPVYSFNANRDFSPNGTVFSGIFWPTNQAVPTPQPTQNFKVSLFSGVTGSPPSSAIAISAPLPTSSFQEQKARGDFYGDGFESLLFLDTTVNQLGIWKDPVATNAQPWDNQYFPLQDSEGRPVLVGSTDGSVAASGDFNGDGHTDILLWNKDTNTGKVLLMNGATVVGQIAVAAAKASDWAVVGAGDITETGYSDIVLQDTNGNVEILFFGASGLSEVAEYNSSSFPYASTSNYNKQWAPLSGYFDLNWKIVGVGDFNGQGYADILWVSLNRQLGLTTFAFNQPTVLSNRVFAQTPSADEEITALGDYNGDGIKDILLYNKKTDLATVWYIGWFGGDLYQVGPTFTPN